MRSSEKHEKRYPREQVLRSRQLAGYQRDFAAVILTEEEYSLREAKEILERKLG